MLLQWLPVAALLILLPLYTRYRIYDSQISLFSWSAGDKQLADILLYCKQELMTLLAGCFLLLFAWQLFKTKRELNTEFRTQWHMMVPAVVYLLLAFVSSLCSDYRTAAFAGTDSQFESFFCLAGYILAMLAVSWLVQKEQDAKQLIILLAILAVVMGILGLFQYSGNDPFTWEWVQRLITPKGYVDTYGSIGTIFEEDRVSLTSYNPNYAGVLLTLLAAFFLALVFTERRKKVLIPEIILLLVLLVALAGTGSKAGLLVFAGITVVALFLLAKKLLKRWKFIVPILLVLLVGGTAAVCFSSLPIFESLKTSLMPGKSPENPIQELTTSEDGIHVEYNGVSFDVSYDIWEDEFHLYVLDETGISMEPVANAETMSYSLPELALADVSIRPALISDSLYGIILNLNSRDWSFVRLEDGYYYINHFGYAVHLTNTERIGFEGYEMFATARGLIWSTTFPLLKETLLLGVGANNFVFAYPQTNYVDMYHYLNTVQVVSRPHNMYLQTAVESGVVALLALLIFYGWYLVQSLRLCWKSDFSGLTERLSFACFLAVTAYLVCGLTNDSMITVAPVFWGILGAGIAANRMMKE